MRLKIILGLSLALFVLLALMFVSSNHKRVQQAKQEARSAEALTETAKEAAETVIARSASDSDIDKIVAQAAKEIENAPNEKAAGDAARAAICRMPNYRNHPSCVMQ